MECELVKLDNLSNDETSIYSLFIEDENKTLFDMFIEENVINHKAEVEDIIKRLHNIGKVGARIHFFKVDEGVPGDGVCALYDNPNSYLRLYCIRYGTQIVILGNGGYKPKSVKKFQEVDKLKEENYFLRKISKEITQRLSDNDILITNDFKDFEGDLTFNFDDYEN